MEPDTVRLDDGRQVHVRPIEDDDTDALSAMHDGLSSLSVQRRFLGALPHLSLPQAEHFTHVDGRQRVAFVAEVDDGRLVAVGRYDRLDDETVAELAVVVTDEFQHHGLGTALVRLLAAHASEHGVTSLCAEVSAENQPMMHALRDAGLSFTARWSCGVASLDIPLPVRT